MAMDLPSKSRAADILGDVDTRTWMREFRDDTSLAALSIPGTHNSPTFYKALPSVRCQAVGITAQLEHGVRFFDIRVQPGNPNDGSDETLYLVHGVFPVSLTGPKKFRHLLQELFDYLDCHPSETIILSLKREGTGNATDQDLSRVLYDHYATDFTAGATATATPTPATSPSKKPHPKWFTEPRIPTLGQVRGKIVILRRFALADHLRSEWSGRGWGLDGENWAHNTADCTQGHVRVQDFCDVFDPANISRKIELCCHHFERAAAVVVCPVSGGGEREEDTPSDVAEGAPAAVHPVLAGPLYLNFLSASNFWKVGCWPERIAARLNPAVTAFLVERYGMSDEEIDAAGERSAGGGGVGIVVCDWVGKGGDWDLVRAIIAMNSKLLKTQRED